MTWNKYPDKVPNIGDMCLIIDMDTDSPETSIETCVYRMLRITTHNDVGYADRACFENNDGYGRVSITPTHWQLLDLPAKEPDHD
jgi:hypothetical protein